MVSFWLCDACAFGAAYDDFSEVSLYCSDAEVERRLASLQADTRALMPLSADFDPQTGHGLQVFSTTPCDACQCRGQGPRYRFTRV